MVMQFTDANVSRSRKSKGLPVWVESICLGIVVPSVGPQNLLKNLTVELAFPTWSSLGRSRRPAGHLTDEQSRFPVAPGAASAFSQIFVKYVESLKFEKVFQHISLTCTRLLLVKYQCVLEFLRGWLKTYRFFGPPA